jgi:hypothetical protein
MTGQEHRYIGPQWFFSDYDPAQTIRQHRSRESLLLEKSSQFAHYEYDN